MDGIGNVTAKPRASVRSPLRLWAASLTVTTALLAPGSVLAATCDPGVGTFVSIEGAVEVRAGEEAWRPAAVGDTVCREDEVRTGESSRAALSLANDAVLRLDQSTTLKLVEVPVEDGGTSVVDLVLGAFGSFSRKPKQIDVNAPHMALAIRGTEFSVRADGEQSVLAVQEGAVLAKNELGELLVPAGSAAVAKPGQAPQPYLVIRPRDAVQWALHFPPVLADPAGVPGLEEVARRLGEGDTAGALAALDRVANAATDPAIGLRRAALLLQVGRVEEAGAAIDRALATDPNAGLGYALRSVVDVAQNRNAEALANAGRAVDLAPGRSAPLVALSYARQATFDLAGARAALLQATLVEPRDALAWARLAEVELMTGHNAAARQAAATAAGIAPDLARVQTVQGFADLAEFRTRSARAAFERAVAADSADPLPRFGLGLAKIREGRLAAGRADLEAAVALDSSNPLLRSYLGKAYFEEKRDDLAGEQFAIAKDLDPLDPTPYLYDALRLQSQNRPVEGLEQLERSIALNDNRAVYRGRLQLDADRAARGTSLARIYDDLGFLDPGRREATGSLTLDPANAGAHRFLADIYQGQRRREIARVSELLQAQMLQDVNLNPIQPSLGETSLNIVTGGGPADAGFNEFTPLFERNGARVSASGLVGTQDTLGGETVVSGLYDGFSASAGVFHYETDGYRDNADVNHNVYSFFLQGALTPQLNAQVELRKRESTEGDLALNVDPNDFLADRKRSVDQETARIGLRWSPTVADDVLLSAIWSDREEATSELDDVVGTDSSADENGYQLEAQAIHRAERFNLIGGLAYTDVDGTGGVAISFDGFPIVDDSVTLDTTHTKGYAYLDATLPDPVTWTLGLSYDDYSDDPVEVDQLNPKLGVQWHPTDDLTLRAAAFRVLKPALVSNRTLEPTQVAGFNQLYDDINGTGSWNYGLGADWRVRPGLYAGVETVWRELDEPVTLPEDGSAAFEDRSEQLHRIYLNWAPAPRWALGTGLSWDIYDSDPGIATESGEIPERVETVTLPVSVRYFAPNGLFGGLGVSFVHQDVDRSATDTAAEGSDDFFVVDASLGYRLPKRSGIVSLELLNLFDEGFRFQDDSYREFRDDPSIGPYIPERQIRVRVALSF